LAHYLFDSIILSPNVLPLSLLTRITGSLLVALRSHQLTYTLLSDADISGLSESMPVELLRFVLAPNVLPLSVEALNIISKSALVLLLGHTRYTLLPDVAFGTKTCSSLCLMLTLSLPLPLFCLSSSAAIHIILL
jgi:hypothetical protein